MQAIQQQQNESSHFFQIILRRKLLIILCVVFTLLPILIYNYTSSPVYESTVTIVCEETRGTLPNIELVQTRLGNTFIINQIQEIKSWSLANEVTKALPPKVVESFTLPDPLPFHFHQEEFYTTKIQKNISASPVSNSDVIRINAQARHAESAMIIANTVADVLMQRNLNARLGEIHNVRKTIEDQLEHFKQKVEESERVLRDYKENNKITFLDQESEEIFRRITAAEVEFNRVKSEHEAATKRYKFISEKLSQEREQLVPTITTTTSPRAQRLKESLIELEVKFTTLKVQEYDENHPQMIKLKAQIEETKRSLRDESLKIAKGENTIDPLSQIQQYLVEITALEVEIHTYEAQEKALDDILKGYNNKLTTVPDKELELGRLLRDKAVADNIYTMLLQKREEARITEAERIGNIRVIDPARIPKEPIRPKKILNLIIGLIVGLGIGIGFAFFMDSFDNTIRTTEEVEDNLHLPVFSTIPRIKSRVDGKLKQHKEEKNDKDVSALTSKLIAGRDLKSPATEAFRTLRTNIQFAELNTPVKTIMITSSTPGEGKSLTVANLAIVTAQMGLRTLLIDLDLRKPVQHSLFGKKLIPGIMDLISLWQQNSRLATDQVTISESRDSLIKQIIQPIDIENLFLLTCGTIPPNPAEILASEAMHNLFGELKKAFEVILLDTPPTLTVTDAAILGRSVEGIILVIRAGKINLREIVRTKEILQRLKGNIIGTVLNGVDVQSYSYYNKYY